MAVQALRTGFLRTRFPQKLASNASLLRPRNPVTPAPCATIIPYREERKSKIKKPHTEMVKEGYGMLREELDKMREEWKKVIYMDHLFAMNHGDYEVVWKFDNKEVMRNWVVTTDKDNNEGKSQAEFILGPEKTAVFRGYVNTDVPKDGVVKAAGYCNIKSAPNMVSATIYNYPAKTFKMCSKLYVYYRKGVDLRYFFSVIHVLCICFILPL